MLNLLFGPPRKRASDDDGWSTGWSRGRVRTSAGAVVDEELALTYSAVWCATRAICETVAMLPLVTYRRSDGQNTEHAPDHYLYDLLKTCVNPTAAKPVGSMSFREGRTMHQVNWGNGFAEIEWDAFDPAKRSRVIGLHPIHPSRVRPIDTDRNGRALADQGFAYLVRNNDQSSVALRAHEMLHIPGVMAEDGVWGKGVIAYARESIGFGLATEKHGGSLFSSGAMPRGIVYGAGMKSAEARKLFRGEWKEIHGSPDSNEIAILPLDAKFQQVTVSPEDSQFLQTRKHNVTEISRWYRVPPHKIMDLERATFSNIEEQAIEFVIDGILPWVRRWEEQINLKLLLPEERGQIFVEHVLAGLLRGNTQARMQSYQVALNNGIMTLNEVRRLENLNGIGPAGDKHYVPLNLTTAEAMETALSMSKAPLEDPPPPDDPAPAGADDSSAAAGDPGADILALPDYRQELDYDCGPAVVHSVCEFWGVGPAEHSAYLEALGTTPEAGTTVPAVIEFLVRQGLSVVAGGGLGVEDLKAHFLAGRPVICPVQMYGTPQQQAAARSGHYVAVIGVGLGLVIVQDPSAGRRLLTVDDWLNIWFDQDLDGSTYTAFGIAVSADPPDTDPPEPETDTDDADEEGGETEESQAHPAPSETVALAVREIATSTLTRLAGVEAQALRRLSRHPERFLPALEDFVPKHRRLLAEALALLDRPWARPAVTAGAADVAAAWIDQTMAEMLDVAGQVSAAQLPDAVETRIGAWTTRVGDVVDLLIRRPEPASIPAGPALASIQLSIPVTLNQTAAAPPVVNVSAPISVPEAPAPAVEVHVPAPVVNVSAPEAPAPTVEVHVPAPVVNVSAPEPPDNPDPLRVEIVGMPTERKEIVFLRDREGKIESAKVEDNP
jgi:HK97 family phage portal protein